MCGIDFFLIIKVIDVVQFLHLFTHSSSTMVVQCNNTVFALYRG